ncbi:Scr1 family TA system antitoxin-like transcriptional regulator [Streptomyces bacillaris]|uniref:Scr1 family TA system antitoxin-like transcriptional regulator n=1 Tax=Streptomyces bacillaris TaxID=68179 RepID=UPI0034604250
MEGGDRQLRGQRKSRPVSHAGPGDGATVLYSESRGQGHVTDSAKAVGDARTTFERLRANARDPDESLSRIREIAEEYAR